MAETKTVKFIITRQDTPDSAPYEEEFEVAYRPNMNVISALMEIRRNPVNAKGQHTTPITWEMNCLGRGLWCLFNGHQRQAAPILFSACG